MPRSPDHAAPQAFSGYSSVRRKPGWDLMSRRMGRMLAASLAAGLALSAGAAAAAPIGMLKQFKVPTANSQPRAITNGSDGNRWFTESDVNNNFAKIARITP